MKPKVSRERTRQSSTQKLECKDKKCPIHTDLAVRGFKLTGNVVSAKMNKTVVIEIPRVREIAKYKRYEKRKTRLSVHNPECINAKVGDSVLVQECRPLSKTKNFVIIKKLEQAK